MPSQRRSALKARETIRGALNVSSKRLLASKLSKFDEPSDLIDLLWQLPPGVVTTSFLHALPQPTRHAFLQLNKSACQLGTQHLITEIKGQLQNRQKYVSYGDYFSEPEYGYWAPPIPATSIRYGHLQSVHLSNKQEGDDLDDYWVQPGYPMSAILGRLGSGGGVHNFKLELTISRAQDGYRLHPDKFVLKTGFVKTVTQALRGLKELHLTGFHVCEEGSFENLDLISPSLEILEIDACYRRERNPLAYGLDAYGIPRSALEKMPVLPCLKSLQLKKLVPHTTGCSIADKAHQLERLVLAFEDLEPDRHAGHKAHVEGNERIKAAKTMLEGLTSLRSLHLTGNHMDAHGMDSMIATALINLTELCFQSTVYLCQVDGLRTLPYLETLHVSKVVLTEKRFVMPRLKSITIEATVKLSEYTHLLLCCPALESLSCKDVLVKPAREGGPQISEASLKAFAEFSKSLQAGMLTFTFDDPNALHVTMPFMKHWQPSSPSVTTEVTMTIPAAAPQPFVLTKQHVAAAIDGLQHIPHLSMHIQPYLTSPSLVKLCGMPLLAALIAPHVSAPYRGGQLANMLGGINRQSLLHVSGCKTWITGNLNPQFQVNRKTDVTPTYLKTLSDKMVGRNLVFAM